MAAAFLEPEGEKAIREIVLGCVPLDLRENEVKACSCMGLRRF